MKQFHHTIFILLTFILTLFAKSPDAQSTFTKGLYPLDVKETKIGSVEELGKGYLFIQDREKVGELFNGSFSSSHLKCERDENQLFPPQLPLVFTHKHQKYEIKVIPKADSTKSKNAIAIIRNNKDTLGLYFDPGNHSGRYLRGFTQTKDEWTLELRGTLIINGVDINKKHGYEESFGYSLLRGEPFYFFKADDGFSFYYNGMPYKYGYTYIHHYACCEPYEYNPIACKEHINFFAQRDGEWYWVTVK